VTDQLPLAHPAERCWLVEPQGRQQNGARTVFKRWLPANSPPKNSRRSRRCSGR
jgi:hypothetical protein